MIATEPAFSVDWTSTYTPVWLALFTELGWIGKPELHILEIGAFEGRTTCWLLDNVLTHPSSRITCVDTFDGSAEHATLTPDALPGLFARFTANVAPYGARVKAFRMTSGRYLRAMPPHPTYDMVYVDGSHRAHDVLTDAVLAWPVLKRGGLLLFDDATWEFVMPDTGEKIQPRRGIDAFLAAFAGQYDYCVTGGQIGVLKRNAT